MAVGQVNLNIGDLLVVISKHYMKKYCYHENTKKFWLLFVFSPFRAFVIDLFWFSASGGSGLGISVNFENEKVYW